jgi:hypothetical protein
MAKPAKRRRARQAVKLRPGAPHPIGENPVIQGPALLRRGERESVEDPLDDFSDDEAAQDRWLLEREGEDMQRDDH